MRASIACATHTAFDPFFFATAMWTAGEKASKRAAWPRGSAGPKPIQVYEEISSGPSSTRATSFRNTAAPSTTLTTAERTSSASRKTSPTSTRKR